ncbi:CheR family methyltransferase [Piscirickettsia litoralis]|uniref:CheR-type methyltransferase domain-containing protein n=1 Tax=Piscirickettsia litoralis TaxID=1891921 RepID=A0ABX3A397_9GAMM|nr:CheR family methyltransferase [Piscirickettsia litoralis]ODN42111.1 hypothetical protein BGC07_03055 [Piscirickettsia litoralis]
MTKKCIRIWSAACSTGEEAYSIGMSVLDYFYMKYNFDAKITASDIDHKVLSHAQKGVYLLDKASDIYEEYLRRWWLKGTDLHMYHMRAKRELKEIIHFKKLNLLGSCMFEEKFDVIFCRNVLFYFKEKDQKKAQAMLARNLKVGGYLIFGHAEKFYPMEGLVNVSTGVYNKVS